MLDENSTGDFQTSVEPEDSVEGDDGGVRYPHFNQSHSFVSVSGLGVPRGFRLITYP